MSAFHFRYNLETLSGKYIVQFCVIISLRSHRYLSSRGHTELPLQIKTQTFVTFFLSKGEINGLSNSTVILWKQNTILLGQGFQPLILWPCKESMEIDKSQSVGHRATSTKQGSAEPQEKFREVTNCAG